MLPILSFITGKQIMLLKLTAIIAAFSLSLVPQSVLAEPPELIKLDTHVYSIYVDPSSYKDVSYYSTPADFSIDYSGMFLHNNSVLDQYSAQLFVDCDSRKFALGIVFTIYNGERRTSFPSFYSQNRAINSSDFQPIKPNTIVSKIADMYCPRR